MTSPLKWPGGKSYLAKQIAKRMPPCKTYVEPYAGGLSVLLAREPDGVSEVVNDRNGHLTNFWNVLRNPESFRALQRLLEATPFSEQEWDTARDSLVNGTCCPTPGFRECCPTPGLRESSIQQAWAFFVCCRQSLAGRMKSFAPISTARTRRGMNEQVSAWWTAVEGLPAVHERLKRVLILNRDAVDVIHNLDGPETLVYADPPYLHETRTSTTECDYSAA